MSTGSNSVAYARQKQARDADREAFNAKRRAAYAARKDRCNEYSRAYYAKHRDRLRARMRERAALVPIEARRQAKREWIAKDRLRNRAKYLWVGAKQRASRRGLEFTIEVSDIVIPARCPVLDIPIVVLSGVKTQDGAPTIDRIDNGLGYTPDNIRVISFRANALKRDMTLAEAKALVANWVAR